MSSLLSPGHNCWQLARAGRVGVLRNTDTYYATLREVCARARRSIYIAGWDFDHRTPLVMDTPGDDLPTQAGPFLEALAARTEGLNIHLLIWDMAPLFTAQLQKLGLDHSRLFKNPRIHAHLNRFHPPDGSNHIKLVVVDDEIALCGGMDVALSRWDSAAHKAEDTHRRNPDGKSYRPYHDVQMMVSGPIARTLGGFYRDQWATATGDGLHAPGRRFRGAAWPESVPVLAEQVDLAISRTLPEWNGQSEVRETEPLFVDLIRAAERTLYIEQQYLTADGVLDALEDVLRRRKGPEIVIVLPATTSGLFAQHTMDPLMAEARARLRRADRSRRLRLYAPHVPGLKGTSLNVHAKVMIVDDRVLHVGSANMNNRSMGLDSECGLTLDAGQDEAVRTAIDGVRTELVAEMLALPAARVGAALARNDGRLVPTIETLRHKKGNTLRPFRKKHPLRHLLRVAPRFREVMDPDRPFQNAGLGALAREPGRIRPLLPWLAVALFVLAVAAVMYWTPVGEGVSAEQVASYLRGLPADAPQTALIAVGFYVAATAVFVPMGVLFASFGLVFGWSYGLGYAVTGMLAALLVFYGIGQLAGHRVLTRHASPRVRELSRKAGEKGLPVVIAIRLLPIAPVAVVNMAMGASHVRLGPFLAGSLIVFAPSAVVWTFVGDQAVNLMEEPNTGSVALLLGVATALPALLYLLHRLVVRRFRHFLD